MYSTEQLKNAGHAGLSLVVVFALLVSMIGAPLMMAMPVAAQEDPDPTPSEVVVCEPWSGDSWHALLNFDVGSTLSSVYCSAAGLFGAPSEASNSVELEEGAYVQHGAMAELSSEMRSDVNDKADEWAWMAYADGEQEIIEARYNDESKSVARAEGRLATNDGYATQYGTLYEGHNNLWRDAFIWGQATTADPNADTIISVELEAVGSASGSTMSSAHVEFTDNSTLQYGNISLPNGDDVEVITGVDNVAVSGYESEPTEGYEYANLRILDPDQTERTVAVEFYGGNDSVVSTYDSNDRIYIVGDDPNGGTDEISLQSGEDNYWLAQAMYELETDRSNTVSDVDTRADEVYTEIAAGEVNPANYYGPREFYGDYGSSMETSVAAQLYFHQQVGYETAPDMRMIVNDSGETYEGGVLVDNSEDAPLVYDETPNPLSSTGDVTLDSHEHKGVLSFDSDNETSVTFVDNSDYDTANLSINVINVDNETVSVDGSNVSATFSESDMQDSEFVIFEAVHDDGTTVTESGTYVLFADDTTTEIRGFVVGENYSGYSMLYLTDSGDIEDRQLGNSWTLSENYDADSNEKAVAVTHEGVDTSFTGSSAKDRIETQQTIKDAVGERDDITSTPAGGSAGDGISSLWAGLGGFALGIIVIMGVGFVLLVLFLVGRVTSIA